MLTQRSITREDIAEIYDQLSDITLDLDRSIEFENTAENIREIDKMKPLVSLYNTAGPVRSESSNW